MDNMDGEFRSIDQQYSREYVDGLMALSFMDLVHRASLVHRENFNPNEVQASRLTSIKTGGCPEDCGYCNQSAKFDTGLKASKLMDTQKVLAEARAAKTEGASRFCMGAAWREPKERDMEELCSMVKEVKALGLETCMTLGMLSDEQSEQLADAGLDYYNHNIDTSPEYYPKVISTRTFEDRINTLERVRRSGMKVCCGGIVGMGEEPEDRVGFLLALANMSPPPESVPINGLMPTQGTPLGRSEKLSSIDFIKVVAVARILMPKSYIRLSAGRESMSDEMQALCFLCGANSIFIGERLLTTNNPGQDKDSTLFEALGVQLV